MKAVALKQATDGDINVKKDFGLKKEKNKAAFWDGLVRFGVRINGSATNADFDSLYPGKILPVYIQAPEIP